MTREEAIKQMEQLQRFCSIRTGQSKDGAFAKDCKALEMAITSIRDQKTQLDRSKWEGCECCKEECRNCAYTTQRKLCKKSCKDGSEFVRRITGRYCRECGRPLTEDAWAELEKRIGENDGKTD